MSKSFTHFFKLFFKDVSLVPSNNSEVNRINGLTLGTVAIGITLGHCAYALKTCENKIVKIDRKYKFDRNGFTEFMIIDDNGKHYNVNNSLWYWKWDSIEDWHKLEPNKDIAIKYYGWRVPLFGLFPNIIMCDQDKVLDSITSAECRVIESKRNEEKQNKELTDKQKEEIKIAFNPYYQLWKKLSAFDEGRHD